MLRPNLKSERLLLRPLKRSDAPSIEDICSKRAVSENLARVPYPYPEGSAEEWLDREARGLAGINMAITHKADLIGLVGIKPFEGDALLLQRDRRALHVGTEMVADQGQRLRQGSGHGHTAPIFNAFAFRYMRLHNRVKLDAYAWLCHASMMKKQPGETTVRAWARLLRAQHSAQSQVEKSLKDGGFPPLSWYDVLLELERAGKAGLRPFELERHLLLPQYGLSRLLDRIETAGYLERRPCPHDARGQVVLITKEGRRLRSKMWPIYGAALRAALADRLTLREQETLSGLLGKLID